jgi:nitrous oxidase accessory protein
LVMKKKMFSTIALTLLLTSMLTFAFNIQPGKAAPKTWYVDDSGGSDFTKIQDAIYAAKPGDTIYVYNGTYNENLVVSKDDLTIVGESKSDTVIDGGGKLVIEISSSGVVLSGFTVRNGGQWGGFAQSSAIMLWGNLCNISDNLVSDSRYGIVAFYAGEHIISSNTVRNTGQGIVSYYSNNNTVFGNAVSEGVQVGSDPPYGIQVYGGGPFNSITENVVSNINYTGIRMTYGERNVVMGNTVSNSSVGISASFGSFLNTIAGNVVSNGSIGVEIWDSNNNTVVDNSISTSTDRGISLEASYNNKVIGNTLSDNNYGINVGTSHDNEVSDNTVANCTNEGILMGQSFSNTVTNNTITESNIAVYLGDSDSNKISENTATSNAWGLWLVDSKDNEANHNRIIDNRGGLLVLGADSSDNIIRGNIIKNTTDAHGAIFLHTCNNNTIYHNSFVENALPQIFNYASVNTWDNGYPSGGNYWSDYSGSDSYSGPFQNLTDGDGIGDTPYIIDTDNIDHYPIMTPCFSLTYTLTITATTGGTTNPTFGTHTYALDSYVQVEASPNTNYILSYWKLDAVNVGSANPYTVLIDTNHTLEPVFTYSPPPPLVTTINPVSISIILGQSVSFTSTTVGGTPPYSYQWYLNDTPVLGAALNSWTFASQPIGSYSVCLNVTDSSGNSTQSDPASITVTAVPGDVDGNGRVDIGDVSMALDAFGSYSTHPRWNSNADMCCDGKIDMADVIIILMNYGKH